MAHNAFGASFFKREDESIQEYFLSFSPFAPFFGVAWRGFPTGDASAFPKGFEAFADWPTAMPKGLDAFGDWPAAMTAGMDAFAPWLKTPAAAKPAPKPAAKPAAKTTARAKAKASATDVKPQPVAAEVVELKIAPKAEPKPAPPEAAAPKAAAKTAAPKPAAPKPAAPKAAPKPAAKADTSEPALLYKTKPAQVDDLKLIKGVGPKLEKELNDLGVYTFAQVAELTPKNLIWIDDNLTSFKGRSVRDDWVGQAGKLLGA